MTNLFIEAFAFFRQCVIIDYQCFLFFWRYVIVVVILISYENRLLSWEFYMREELTTSGTLTISLRCYQASLSAYIQDFLSSKFANILTEVCSDISCIGLVEL